MGTIPEKNENMTHPSKEIDKFSNSQKDKAVSLWFPCKPTPNREISSKKDKRMLPP